MTYFRCGGGGIPSSLKTDMNDVLNKKFGTSTDYPPADWAPTVNLMGPLPEKTQASASICSFDDGADDVPTKSLVVTIPPTLSGVSTLTETQTGKNLCQNNLSTETVSGVTITVNADGTITLDGTATARIPRNLCTNFEMKAGTYTLSCGTSNLPASCYFNINITGGGGGSCSRNTPSLLITLPETRTATYIRIDLANGSTFDNLVLYPMLEVGSTATTYEQYQTPTQYSASLGRTIYGGTADIVNGTGQNTHGKITDFSTLRANGTSSTGAYRYIIDVSGMGDYNVGACVSNLLTYRVSYNANVGEFYNTTNVLIIFLAQDNAQDAITYLQSNSCEIAYPLATPTDFTFDGQEIPTRLGYNAFWADSGDTEVTYRADIDLLLGGN